MKYPLLSIETAPSEARSTLQAIEKAWGFVPNLGAALAASPAAVELLWAGYGSLSARATLSPAEQQLVCVAASRANQCAYCVSAHSTMALGAKLDAGALQAARDGRPVNDRKLEALRLVTTQLVERRGWLSDDEKQAFVDSGYSAGQLLEVVGWVAMKTLTNYVNHIAATPLDAAWENQKWLPQSESRLAV